MLKGIQPKKLVRRSKDTLLGMTEKDTLEHEPQ